MWSGETVVLLQDARMQSAVSLTGHGSSASEGAQATEHQVSAAKS